jgi:hypothetical protein
VREQQQQAAFSRGGPHGGLHWLVVQVQRGGHVRQHHRFSQKNGRQFHGGVGIGHAPIISRFWPFGSHDWLSSWPLSDREA